MSRYLYFVGVVSVGLSTPLAGVGDVAGAAGKDARTVTQKALQFGVAGDVERQRSMLAEAIKLDSNYELARWHRGEVQWQGEWLGPSEYASRLASDEVQQNYLKRRAKLTGNPKQEANLARWCSSQKMPARSRFHFRQVLQNAASDEALRVQARRGLGLKLHHGVWKSPAQMAEFDRNRKSFQAAENRWSRQVQRWSRALEGANVSHAEYARRQLKTVTDIDIIPILEQQMSRVGEKPALDVVAWLSGRQQFEATESLLRHALLAPWPSAIQAAISGLAERPIHDFVPQLLGRLVPSIDSRHVIRQNAFGDVFYRHELFRRGRSINELMRADFMTMSAIPTIVDPKRFFAPRRQSTKFLVTEVPDRQPKTLQEKANEFVRRRQLTELGIVEAKLRSAKVHQDVIHANRAIDRDNDRALKVLEGTTNAKVGRQAEAWWDWWDDYNELFVPTKPTRYLYGSQTEYNNPGVLRVYYRLSCFASGTPVRTDAGLLAIQEIRPGCRVLAQDADTGELKYQVVIATTTRPDTPLLEITVEDSSIFATKGHPFWVNGKGWRMAKRLQTGDIVHTLEGPQEIKNVRSTKTPAPAHNLVVDGFNSYFVGNAGVLVHDNTPRQPTLALTPGLLRTQLQSRPNL